MRPKIIGVTVGTSINPQRIGEMIENGKSAYELALEEGFKGTKEEWLASLKGEDGDPGKTPVKGVDYYTDADKADMVTAVLTALPTYNGEVVSV